MKVIRLDLYRKILASIVLLTFFLNGCVTMQLPEYEAKPSDQYPLSQGKDGLSVAVHPLTNKEESEKYFGMNLQEAGILAVFVNVENRSSSSSFLIFQDRFSLRGRETDVKGSSGHDQVSSETGGEGALIVGALLLGLPAVFMGWKMVSDVTVVKHNFISKQFQTKTVSPGEVATGFVYFQIPRENFTLEQWLISLEALDLRSKENKIFDIPLK